MKKTSRLIIVHEDTKLFGIGAEVSALVAEEGFDFLDAPIMRIAGPEIPAMPFSPTLEDKFLPNPGIIADAIRKLSEY